MILKFLLTASLAATILASCEAQNSKKNHENVSKKETTTLTSSDTSQLMNENEFWKIIDKSKKGSTNYQEQISSLKTILLDLESTEIEKFDNTFSGLLATSYDYKLWGAAYVINGGCSDDCFDYFRQYLIAHGREKFYQTLKNPESCVNWIKFEEEENWEGLQYSATEAYKEKTGKEIPKAYQPKFELKGKPFDEETVFKQYPELAKKFME